jgi:hypothetical protein
MSVLGIGLGLPFSRNSAAAAASGTLNSSDKDAAITLSNGNLTATSSTAGSFKSVRSTTSHSTGKWCFGFTTNGTSLVTANCLAGIATSTANLATYVGFDASGWGWYNQNGEVLNNNVNRRTSGTWPSAASQWNIVCVDLDTGNMWVYNVNGALWNGNPASNPVTATDPISPTVAAGTWFAAVSLNNSVAGGTVTVDFTGANFAVPSGFSAWG